MVEGPIDSSKIEAFRRVEQIMMEEALDLKLPPEEAQKQTKKLLEPVMPNSSPQEQPLKKAA